MWALFIIMIFHYSSGVMQVFSVYATVSSCGGKLFGASFQSAAIVSVSLVTLSIGRQLTACEFTVGRGSYQSKSNEITPIAI